MACCGFDLVIVGFLLLVQLAIRCIVFIWCHYLEKFFVQELLHVVCEKPQQAFQIRVGITSVLATQTGIGFCLSDEGLEHWSQRELAVGTVMQVLSHILFT